MPLSNFPPPRYSEAERATVLRRSRTLRQPHPLHHPRSRRRRTSPRDSGARPSRPARRAASVPLLHYSNEFGSRNPACLRAIASPMHPCVLTNPKCPGSKRPAGEIDKNIQPERWTRTVEMTSGTFSDRRVRNGSGPLTLTSSLPAKEIQNSFLCQDGLIGDENVAGAWDYHQFRCRNPCRDTLAVLRRDQPVIFPMDHQRRRGNLREPAVRFPRHHGLQLREVAVR